MKKTAILFLLLSITLFSQENLEGNVTHVQYDLLGPGFASFYASAPWSQGTVHISDGNYDSSWVQRYADYVRLYDIDTLLMREDYSAIDGEWNHVKRGIFSIAEDTITYFYDAPIGTKLLPDYDASPDFRRQQLQNGLFVSMDVEYRYFIQNDGTVHFAGMPDEDSSLIHIAGKIDSSYLAVFYIGGTENPGFRYFLIDANAFPSYDLQTAEEVTFYNNIRPLKIRLSPEGYYVVEDTAGNLDVYDLEPPGQFRYISHIASNASQYWGESFAYYMGDISVLQLYPEAEDSINCYSFSSADTTYYLDTSLYQREFGDEVYTDDGLFYFATPIYNSSGRQIVGFWHIMLYDEFEYHLGFSVETPMDVLPGKLFFYIPEESKVFFPRYDYVIDVSQIDYDTLLLDSDFSGRESAAFDASRLFPEGYMGWSASWYVNGEFANYGPVLSTELPTGTNEVMLGVPKNKPSNYYTTLNVDVYAKEIDLGADVVHAISSYGNYVYVPTANNKIFCFDDEGGLITQLNTQGAPSTHISIMNGRLAFMTDAGKLYCTDSLLNVLWQKDISEPVQYAPLIFPSEYGSSQDVIYLFAGDSLMRFNSNTGSYNSYGFDKNITTQPVMAVNSFGLDIVFIMGIDYTNLGIYSLNHPGYKEFELSDTIAGPISINEQYAFVHTQDGNFYRMLWYLGWGGIFGENDTLHHSGLHSSSTALITSDKDIYIVNDTDDPLAPAIFKTGYQSDDLTEFEVLSSGMQQVSASPWLTDDHHMYVTLKSNRLQEYYLMDAQTLEENWWFQANDSLTAHPLVTSNNVVFLPEKGGRLYLLREPSPNVYKGVNWATYMGDGSRNRIIDFIVGDIEDNTSEVPEEFSLRQNYPNPFNPATVIEFDIPEETAVTIVIYDILGNKVSEPVNSTMNPGTYKLTFDASGLASGIYFYRLTAGSFTAIKKMMLLR